jgi:uncharacterized membrane protein
MKKGTYDALGLYRDPDDRRLIVPKQNPTMGWTINVSHPAGPSALLCLGVAIAASIAAAVILR